ICCTKKSAGPLVLRCNWLFTTVHVKKEQDLAALTRPCSFSRMFFYSPRFDRLVASADPERSCGVSIPLPFPIRGERGLQAGLRSGLQ
ncbi:MAG: hypothetical protein IIY94_01065, partial [Oscillospiraceae bacterium]|nr:hypothetical protein [Oscillospiraceae bacterium]